MSAKKVFMIQFIILIAFAVLADAQEIVPLRNIVMETGIAHEGTSAAYEYRYSVYNPISNSGQVTFVEIDISKPAQSLPLESAGLVIEEGFNWKNEILTASFDEEMKSRGHLIKKETVPVGVKFPSCLIGPLNWSAGITIESTVLWGGSEKCQIMPGQKLGGFVITSYGLPAIREVTVQPAIDYDSLPDEYIENTELTRQLRDRLTFHGKTVGPTAPPKDLNYQDFLDSIISMKHEAYELGWITNEGVEKSLDAKLDGAKKKLLSGSFVPARKLLDAFVNEVEAQGCETYDNCPKGKHLRPEAYALLKYNALYLIEHLK